MTPPVYVDPLQGSPDGPGAGRTFRAGRQFSHLMAADFSPEAIDALHALAAKIGLKREWFQAAPPASWPHYDITASVRAKAVAAGAVEETAKAGAERRMAVRAALKAGEST